ncbi:helix-turn-helix domain-containing protein [Amycolatopsis sp. lyj-23]|uniref:helix-turn-helix domain-containing protein n=1 Tax=Amycolatopsis sp. lyj-23 TaxID=2789283 RepID=UPI00397D1AD6
MTNKESLGKLVHDERRAQKLSQIKLGELATLSQTTLSQLELGKRQLRYVTDVVRVADALGLSRNKFVLQAVSDYRTRQESKSRPWYAEPL